MSVTSAYERWELPVVGPNMPRGRAVPTRPLTAAQIDELQRQAYDEAAKDGHQAGYDEGYRQGLQKANAQLLQSVQGLHNVCNALSRPVDMMDETVVRSMLDVVLAVSRHLVAQELTAKPEQILVLIDQALKLVPIATDDLTLYVNPADAQVIREHATQESTWRLIEDVTISRGGCRVEHGASCVDATIEQRVERLMSQLTLGLESSDDI